METVFNVALDAIAAFLLSAGALTFALMVKGTFELRRLARETPRADQATLLKSRMVPSVSAIAAPADSGAAARARVRLLLGLHFGNHEVVLALDGPSDADLMAWGEEFHLTPSLRRVAGPLPMSKVRGVYESRDPIPLVVVALEPGGPAMALNAAVNAAQSPVIGWFGPECEFPPEALLQLVPPMLRDPQNTIAVIGVAPAAAGAGIEAQFAALDFLRGWLIRQAALSTWNLITPTPGSAMLILRDPIVKAGGFQAGMFELTLRLISRQAGRVAFLPASGCYQRTAQSLTQLQGAALRERAELALMLRTEGLPPRLHGGILALGFLQPPVEVAAYFLTIVGLAGGWVSWQLACLILLCTVGLGTLLSMAAVALRELAEFQGSDPSRLARMFFASIPENLWFRQLRNLWLLTPSKRRTDKSAMD